MALFVKTKSERGFFSGVYNVICKVHNFADSIFLFVGLASEGEKKKNGIQAEVFIRLYPKSCRAECTALNDGGYSR